MQYVRTSGSEGMGYGTLTADSHQPSALCGSALSLPSSSQPFDVGIIAHRDRFVNSFLTFFGSRFYFFRQTGIGAVRSDAR